MSIKRNVGPWSRGQFVALLIIVLLATAIRLIHLDAQSLWYDESARVYIASRPLSRLFTAMAEETPAYLPFYFLLVKPFTQPFHETMVRFPSVVFGVLTVVFCAQVGRNLSGRNAGLLVTLLTAVNPFHIWFSKDAGFYTLITLSAVGALYFFIRLLRNPARRLWVGLILLTGVGLWSLYFAFAVPLVEFVYLLITFRRNYRLLRMWTVAHAIAVLPLAPWYIFILRRGEFYFGSAGLKSPQPVELFYTVWNFSIGYTEQVTAIVIISLSLFGIALALGAWAELKKRRPLLLLFFGLPIGMTFFMSYRLPMYMDRYLIGTLPAYLLLVGKGVVQLPKRLRGFLWAGLIAVSLLGTARTFYDTEYFAKEDWRGVAAHIQAHEQPGDVIMPLLYQSLVPLIGQYYRGDLAFEPLIVQGTVHPPETFSGPYQRLWYIAPHYNNSSHFLGHCRPFDLYKDAEEPQIQDWLKEHQDQMVQRVDLSCVSVLLYDMTDE